MPCRRSLAVSLLLLTCLVATAKEKKKKAPLPPDVLRARTAWVIVDPNAGVDVEDPTDNQRARADVETALAKWGRLIPVTDPSQADLIIVVRKGNGKLVQPTIGGTPMNDPPPVIGQRTDTTLEAGGRVGPRLERQQQPHPEMQVGGKDDTFTVYRGNPSNGTPASNRDPNSSNRGLDNPLDSPPVWRYSAKNALESPSVPAVDQFRKAMEKTEKVYGGP